MSAENALSLLHFTFLSVRNFSLIYFPFSSSLPVSLEFKTAHYTNQFLFAYAGPSLAATHAGPSLAATHAGPSLAAVPWLLTAGASCRRAQALVCGLQ